MAGKKQENISLRKIVQQVHELSEKGLTQQEISKQLGIAQSSVNRHLSTQRSLVRASEQDVRELKEQGFDIITISKMLDLTQISVMEYLGINCKGVTNDFGEEWDKARFKLFKRVRAEDETR